MGLAVSMGGAVWYAMRSALKVSTRLASGLSALRLKSLHASTACLLISAPNT